MSTKRNTRNSLTAASTSKSAAREHMLQLIALKSYITCPLCEGYFVDATTVIDCLHTFCKSCLLDHFEENNDCPKCHFMIHQSHPSHYVAFDRTMQDIVYKLVPGMQAEEMKRREEFEKKLRKKRLMGNGNSWDGNENVDGRLGAKESEENRQCCSTDKDPALSHHRRDEKVFLHLVPEGKLKFIKRPFVHVSGLATVNTIKKLLAYFTFNDIIRYNEFDVYCNNELMGRDYSMSFIHKTRWRNRPSSEPLVLKYREHVDF